MGAWWVGEVQADGAFQKTHEQEKTQMSRALSGGVFEYFRRAKRSSQRIVPSRFALHSTRTPPAMQHGSVFVGNGTAFRCGVVVVRVVSAGSQNIGRNVLQESFKPRSNRIIVLIKHV